MHKHTESYSSLSYCTCNNLAVPLKPSLTLPPSAAQRVWAQLGELKKLVKASPPPPLPRPFDMMSAPVMLRLTGECGFVEVRVLLVCVCRYHWNLHCGVALLRSCRSGVLGGGLWTPRCSLCFNCNNQTMCCDILYQQLSHTSRRSDESFHLNVHSQVPGGLCCPQLHLWAGVGVSVFADIVYYISKYCK